MVGLSDIQDDNPYNPLSTDYGATTPPLDQVIRTAIQAAALQDINVCRPAIVLAVTGTQYVTIQIMIMVKYKGALVPTLLAPIQDVPVMMPAGSLYSMKFPIAVGDTGLAVFSDRSLEQWTVAGGLVDPADSRSHSLSDAIFIPGLASRIGQVKDLTEDLVISAGEAELRLSPTGEVRLGNALVDVVASLKSLVDTMTTATTIIGGPFTPDVIAQLVALSAQLETIVSL